MDSAKKTSKPEFVPRVNQLDALQLDKDILRIVRDQLMTAIQNISPALANRLSPEIDLLLRTIIWTYSVGIHSATFGQRLLFIGYNESQLSSNYTLHKHFLLNVLLKYIRDNVTYRFTDRRSLQNFIQKCEQFSMICSILNMFRFLKIGMRPALTDYILGLDNTTKYGNRRREIGYNYMSRELIWGGFMELLGFSLPLINYHYLRRKFRNVVGYLVDGSAPDATATRPRLTLQTKCAYCDERPTLPYQMGCCHVFCYYCLKGNLAADSNFDCPICQKGCSTMKPL